MKFAYIVVKNGKKFKKSIVSRSLHNYYEFIERQNMRHMLRATGFIFQST